MDSNYIIKVYDKDDTFKRTLSRKDINGDIRYSSVLNSGFSTLPLRIQNKREKVERVGDSVVVSSTLGIDHGDIIKVIDPNQNVVSETTYERLLDPTYDGSVNNDVTIVDGEIVTGNASSVVLSDLILSGEFTIGCNFTATGPAAFRMIFGNSGGTEKVGRSNANKYFIRVINGGSADTTVSMTIGESSYFVLRRDSSNKVDLFANGTSYRLFSDVAQVGNLTIDRFSLGVFNQEWIGSVKNLSVYQQAYTDTEIDAMISQDMILGIPELYYSGLKYTGTPSSPTTILNALPDNTKQTVTDTPIYTGQVIEINHNIAPDQEYHDLDVIGIQTLLNQTLYEHGSSYTFTRTADPAVILKEVIDLVGYLDYTVDSIETYGSNVSVEFDYSTCMDVMKEMQAITGWIVKYDADGTVYFTEKIESPTIDHKLDFRGEVSAVYDETKSYEIVNKLTLHHKSGGSGHTDVFEDLTSQGIYGIREKYIDKQEIQNEDTATEFGNAYIARYANPLQQLKVIVNNTYDIASVKVGDTVKIYGYYNASSTYYIYKLDFTPGNLTLYLNEQTSIETTLYNLINN